VDFHFLSYLNINNTGGIYMSFLRLSFGALLVTMSLFALNANAATDSTSTPAATTSATTTTTTATAAPAPTTTTTVTTHHAKAAAHHAHHAAKNKTARAMVDINTASATELVKVRGISKTKAAAIIAARSKGNFNSVDDLKTLTNAKGKPLFTAKGFARIEKRLTVSNATQSSAAPSDASQAGATQ
jgi:competence protein ComEA